MKCHYFIHEIIAKKKKNISAYEDWKNRYCSNIIPMYPVVDALRASHRHYHHHQLSLRGTITHYRKRATAVWHCNGAGYKWQSRKAPQKQRRKPVNKVKSPLERCSAPGHHRHQQALCQAAAVVALLPARGREQRRDERDAR